MLPATRVWDSELCWEPDFEVDAAFFLRGDSSAPILPKGKSGLACWTGKSPVCPVGFAQDEQKLRKTRRNGQRQPCLLQASPTDVYQHDLRLAYGTRERDAPFDRFSFALRILPLADLLSDVVCDALQPRNHPRTQGAAACVRSSLCRIRGSSGTQFLDGSDELFERVLGPGNALSSLLRPSLCSFGQKCRETVEIGELASGRGSRRGRVVQEGEKRVEGRRGVLS